MPSQEIRYEDQQPHKKEEKESHYSRHVNSNSSFGGGLNNNAKTIFGKQMMAQDEFESQQQYDISNEQDVMGQSELQQRDHQYEHEIRTYVANTSA